MTSKGKGGKKANSSSASPEQEKTTELDFFSPPRTAHDSRPKKKTEKENPPEKTGASPRPATLPPCGNRAGWQCLAIQEDPPLRVTALSFQHPDAPEGKREESEAMHREGSDLSNASGAHESRTADTTLQYHVSALKGLEMAAFTVLPGRGCTSYPSLTNACGSSPPCGRCRPCASRSHSHDDCVLTEGREEDVSLSSRCGASSSWNSSRQEMEGAREDGERNTAECALCDHMPSGWLDVWCHGGRRSTPFLPPTPTREEGGVPRGRERRSSPHPRRSSVDCFSPRPTSTTKPGLEVMSTLLRLRIPTARSVVREEAMTRTTAMEEEGEERGNAALLSSEREYHGGKPRKRDRTGVGTKAKGRGGLPPHPREAGAAEESGGRQGRGAPSSSLAWHSHHEAERRKGAEAPVRVVVERMDGGPALYDHVLFSCGSLLLLHGGRDASGVVQSSLHAYHTRRQCWVAVAPTPFSGACPPRMCGHAVCAMQAKETCFLVMGMAYDTRGQPVDPFYRRGGGDKRPVGEGGGGRTAASSSSPSRRPKKPADKEGPRRMRGMLSAYLLDLDAKHWSHVPLMSNEEETDDDEVEDGAGAPKHAATRHRRPRSTPGARSHFSLHASGHVGMPASSSSLSSPPPPPLSSTTGVFGIAAREEDDALIPHHEENEGEKKNTKSAATGEAIVSSLQVLPLYPQVFLVGGERGGVPLLDAWILTVSTGVWRRLALDVPLSSVLPPTWRSFCPSLDVEDDHHGPASPHTRLWDASRGHEKADPLRRIEARAGSGMGEESRGSGGTDRRALQKYRASPFRLYTVCRIREEQQQQQRRSDGQTTLDVDPRMAFASPPRPVPTVAVPLSGTALAASPSVALPTAKASVDEEKGVMEDRSPLGWPHDQEEKTKQSVRLDHDAPLRSTEGGEEEGGVEKGKGPGRTRVVDQAARGDTRTDTTLSHPPSSMAAEVVSPLVSRSSSFFSVESELDVVMVSCIHSPHFRLLAASAQAPYRITMPVVHLRWRGPNAWRPKKRAMMACGGGGERSMHRDDPTTTVEKDTTFPPSSPLPRSSPLFSALPWARPLSWLHPHTASHPPERGSPPWIGNHGQKWAEKESLHVVDKDGMAASWEMSVGQLACLAANRGNPWIFIYDERQDVCVAVMQSGSVHVTI